ncbi:hypothetical protein LJ656_06115 [Paraburkholderia sp. MMS20-SJTR3]|uniref:DUF4148 domain-containing protein n=1 Tax=Paraburkholderia sejongensis TaxID=2886946 RepID=A0ABS8JR19_9BURK|nr:hypothetical protein [Paraburkholderia sp. MMS20-SJTR3]MCC8392158.1 hypothetical protein [Paraburkholderia sp. MMS20-SJTR3]
MIKHLFVAAVLSASAAVAAPAFASGGYGPAPHYNPIVGAPASQRGQSALTVSAEQGGRVADGELSQQSYGGAQQGNSQSGARAVSAAEVASISPYAHH